MAEPLKNVQKHFLEILEAEELAKQDLGRVFSLESLYPLSPVDVSNRVS